MKPKNSYARYIHTDTEVRESRTALLETWKEASVMQIVCRHIIQGGAKTGRMVQSEAFEVVWVVATTFMVIMMLFSMMTAQHNSPVDKMSLTFPLVASKSPIRMESLGLMLLEFAKGGLTGGRGKGK